ncbi:MAG: UDP-N-acetylglucosamine 1-carboxyvinyltransferase [Candidatus Omnitrophica bacterium]|nr:UDP-N-acetylglucosamine 1-carboxyvinyltransferase [Candidatus Omnitrophota bacterium]MDD5574282.1 UDP-N-acetylglucosamine 1-carboxyvinyltransferase [Candidatus Omnitrophota bacterium]
MDKLIVEGGVPLRGAVEVSGSKNSLLPILAATLLTRERCVLKNAPDLRDTVSMLKLLRYLGVAYEFKDHTISLRPNGLERYEAPYKLVATMRASFCVLGPLLARYRKARVSLPGGCIIGVRPVDLHLKGLSKLGAGIQIKEGYVIAEARRLRGAHIYLGGSFGSSVLATGNVMMAATLASGTTVIENAACEPEVVDLARFLMKMGAKIKGEGSPYLEITGVKELHGAEYEVIPDRIEAATLIMAAGVTRGEVLVKKARAEHMMAVLEKLQDAGMNFKIMRDAVLVKKTSRRFKPTDVVTLPYPGFPTDVQAQFMTLMSVSDGISVITEKIYPDRFMHVAELNRMGAQVKREGPYAVVHGIRCLSGAPVMASDLRASAALVLAGLVARGKTEVSRIYHLDRGYERLEEKLKALGAKIERVKE